MAFTLVIPLVFQIDTQNIMIEKKPVKSICATLSLGMIRLHFEHILNTPDHTSQIGCYTKSKKINAISASFVFYF